ncbi:TPA: hypothetical protein U1B62_000909 [Streptococcus suis]|nr:hypothetical protein [Streptococcus suis]HEM3557599.1 hypothetical protein [Streptococcus suis]
MHYPNLLTFNNHKLKRVINRCHVRHIPRSFLHPLDAQHRLSEEIGRTIEL